MPAELWTTEGRGSGGQEAAADALGAPKGAGGTKAVCVPAEVGGTNAARGASADTTGAPTMFLGIPGMPSGTGGIPWNRWGAPRLFGGAPGIMTGAGSLGVMFGVHDGTAGFTVPVTGMSGMPPATWAASRTAGSASSSAGGATGGPSAPTWDSRFATALGAFGADAGFPLVTWTFSGLSGGPNGLGTMATGAGGAGNTSRPTANAARANRGHDAASKTNGKDPAPRAESGTGEGNPAMGNKTPNGPRGRGVTFRATAVTNGAKHMGIGIAADPARKERKANLRATTTGGHTRAAGSRTATLPSGPLSDSLAAAGVATKVGTAAQNTANKTSAGTKAEATAGTSRGIGAPVGATRDVAAAGGAPATLFGGAFPSPTHPAFGGMNTPTAMPG